MAQYEPEQLGFPDEYSKDERTSSQQHGQLRKGTHAVKVYSFMGTVFWLKDYLQLMGWSQTLLLRAL